VWLQLEEKRIPYKVEKAPLRCYGEKPKSFLRIQPNGVLPVAIIDGNVISESNDIMYIIEESFPEYNPLLPSPESAEARRANSLLKLERRAFSIWFSWLTSSRASGAIDMDFILKEIDAELQSTSEKGPYFLGERLSLVDIMFTPFLERMAASLPYYKGFESRSEKYPHLLNWYRAMDNRESYR
jgi:glutathione S-transferase